MDFISKKIWFFLAFALAACTAGGGGPLGGGLGGGTLDATGGLNTAQPLDAGNSLGDETAATPERQGSKIDLDPGGYYKYLFLARMDMIGPNPDLYDPDKCQKMMDCTVYYMTCEEFRNLTVTWGDKEYQCDIAEWQGLSDKPEITELDCRHMLPCIPLAPLATVDEADDAPKEILFCTKEYSEGKTVQQGDQCRLPSWPEDAWMECEAFHEYCEAHAPKIVQKLETTDEQTFPEVNADELLQENIYEIQPYQPEFELK